MKMKLLSVALVFCTVACADKKIEKNHVVDVLKSSGVELNDIKDIAKDSDAMYPQSFSEHFGFSIPSVAPSGGHVFVCKEKKYCDPLYQYYDALRMLAGPYVYQSKSGKVVMQLNSGLPVDEAEKLEKAIGGL